MKAIVAAKNGPPEVLKLQDLPRPVPADNEILIKVHAATVTRGDVIMRGMHPLFAVLFRLFGIPRKKIPGHEFAGDIEAVGIAVKNYKPGDRVFGTTTGLSEGANAQYVCVSEESKSGVLATMPANMSYEEAAAVPVGGMTALHLLNQANIQSGQKVLVYGASGSVGTFAVQLAKQFGAETTGVTSSANLEWVKSLGADNVIDYTRGDLSQSGETYDVILDAVGKITPALIKGILVENGAFLTVKSLTKEKTEYLVFLREVIDAGALKSVIDRRYPLEQTAKAHAYVETGHKKGNVVITLEHTSNT